MKDLEIPGIIDDDFIRIYFTESQKQTRCHRYLQRTSERQRLLTYLQSRYDDSEGSSIAEIIYRILNGIDKRPLCSICHQHYAKFSSHGYSHYCSDKCKKSPEGRQLQYQLRKSSMQTYLGYENNFQTEQAKQKIKETCLSRYGVENVAQSDQIKDEIKSTICSRYGVNYSGQIPEVIEKRKQTMIQKYGVDCLFKIKEIHDKANCLQSQIKRVETLKKKRFSKMSSIEQKVNEYLKTIFSQSDYTYNYFDKDRYPFKCDFYIFKYDLFIEIHAHWTHQTIPYDESSKTCQNQLNELIKKRDIALEKYGKSKYDEAIKTWTIRDVKKRQTALANNLNYLEIYSNDIKVCIDEINKKISELTK